MVGCIHCEDECPPDRTRYFNWCDNCFTDLPLTKRFPRTTPTELAEMLDGQTKNQAALKAKKLNKQATQAENTANNGKTKKGKRQASDDKFYDGDNLLFDYQDNN